MLGFFRRNSLKTLDEQKKMFLVNYLGDRRFEWGIHDNVKEKYPELQQNINDLEAEGLIKIEETGYFLTEQGKEIRKQFRKLEKDRQEKMQESVMLFSKSGDFLSAYNERASYERASVIPHGIFVGDTCGQSYWRHESELPANVKNYIHNSYSLDFSDCMNTEHFKKALRYFYIGIEITGSNQIELPDNFEQQIGEYLDCPSLDRQLHEKCEFPNPPKLKIYFNTKVSILNLTQTKAMEAWDGQFFLGIYDCSDAFHAAMAQYERMKIADIPSLPKTFKTFYKHKTSGSEKYQGWIQQYEALTE